MASKQSLYDRLGGRATLDRVHKIFYDKVYGDPWLGQFFEGVDQAHIEQQQTNLMGQGMGGPEHFDGTYPIPGHQHLYITRELYQLRTQLKADALEEAGIPADLADEWLAIDRAFERALVKNRIEDCKKRHPDDEVIVIPRP